MHMMDAPWLFPFSRILSSMDLRRVGAAIVASHLLRSWYTPETSESIRLELVEFRTEVQRVEGTLKQTSLVLDHCTSYSSFLTYVLKLLALSELLLLIWIAYLLVIKRPVTRVVQFPSIEGPVSPQSSVSADTNRTSGSEVTARVTRSGPVRPSDLKKTK